MGSLWQSIIDAYHQIPWGTIWGIVVASGAVAIIVEAFKKWLSLRKTWIVQTITLTVSFSMVAVSYLVNEVNRNPAFLGGKGLALSGAATTFYIWGLKPAKAFLAEVNDYKASKTRVAEKQTGVAEAAPEFTA